MILLLRCCEGHDTLRWVDRRVLCMLLYFQEVIDMLTKLQKLMRKSLGESLHAFALHPVDQTNDRWLVSNDGSMFLWMYPGGGIGLYSISLGKWLVLPEWCSVRWTGNTLNFFGRNDETMKFSITENRVVDRGGWRFSPIP